MQCQLAEAVISIVGRIMKIPSPRLLIVVAALAAGCDNPQTPTPANSMSKDVTWNDTTREDLRETLRNLVLGEVRLTHTGYDDIIQMCREVYIDDECPQNERDTFIRFATDELDKAAAEHSAEQATWPPETDSDRLDRVEAALRDRGILLWQVSPCCDTCTGAELPDRIDVIGQRHPGFRDRVRGYAYFIEQNMAEMLAEDTHISVYLGYGWFSPDDANVADEAYEANALRIARDVCDCLREHGFEPDWDGSFSKKIGISLDWQRRKMLE